MKKELKFVGKRVVSATIFASVFVAVAGTSLWALAAFSEPTDSPAASVQDFAKNIMGANNADNAFDSSTVTANADGSMLERLEALENKAAGVTAISAISASSYSYSNAYNYCANLSEAADYAFDGSDTSTIYTDWHVPNGSELSKFVGVKIFTSTTAWTNEIHSTLNQVLTLGVNLNTGTTSYTYSSTGSYRVYCVR